MKTVSLQEISSHYLIEIDQATIEEGPVLLQRAGETVAVLLPIGDYDAFQSWQDSQQKFSVEVPASFETEIAAFEQLKPALLEQYPGRVVAIFQGQVVEVGDDKMEVLGRVVDKFGNIPCYIEWIEPVSPRRARVPSAWIANK